MKSLEGMMRPVYGKLAVSVATGLVRICASLVFVWVCKLLVDIATGKSSEPLKPYIIIMLCTMFVQIVTNVWASWWEGYIVLKTGNSMRLSTFSHVLKSTWNGMESHHSGDYINRIEEDVRVLTDLICVRVPYILITICQLLAASVFLFSMAPNLVWLLIVLMVVAVVGSKMFFKTLRKITDDIRKLDSASQQHMQENLQKRLLVLTLSGTDRVISKLGWYMDQTEDKTIRRLNFNAVSRSFMGFGFFGGYAAAFLWGIFGIRSGAVTFGMMTAFLQLVGQVQKPVADLARHIPTFIQALTSIDRLEELTALPLEDKGDDIHFDLCPEISIDNISFSYGPQGTPTFKDFSCRFEAGQITEIAGPTGIGKSTLIKLILGLLKPSSGTITINGIPASADTRCNFMYVPQGNSLMSGTIRENLLLAKADANEEDMLKALHTAAADFVLDLPDRLDSRCGEAGSGLSEGQSQRIAIARALLCEGTVLILDEATSALDPDTEAVLLDNLQKECNGSKTVLFISHRESVTRICNKIIKL